MPTHMPVEMAVIYLSITNLAALLLLFKEPLTHVPALVNLDVGGEEMFVAMTALDALVDSNLLIITMIIFCYDFCANYLHFECY